MTKWEYMVVERNISEKWRPKKQREEVERFRDDLNKHGAEGWEMISYESIPLTGTFTGNVKGYAYLCFLKRAIG